MPVETNVPAFGYKYVGDDRTYEFHFGNFPETYTETGATPTVTVVAGSGLTIVGYAWNHTTKKLQVRIRDGTVGITNTLKAVLVTTPNAYDLVGFATLEVKADES